MSEDMMTVQECAKYLGLHKVTVYKSIKKGFIPIKRIGKNIRVSKEELDLAMSRDRR